MSETGVPPPDTSTAPSWVDSGFAQKEEAKWPYEDELKGRRHRNEMLWLTCYGWIVAGLTIFFSFMFIASLFIWAWHYLMPTTWSWLNLEQLSKIQSIIFSGSLGAIVTSVIKKQIDKQPT